MALYIPTSRPWLQCYISVSLYHKLSFRCIRTFPFAPKRGNLAFFSQHTQ